MKMKNICIMFIIILGLILSLGCIKSSDSEVEITSLEQEIPESFEDQIKIEIENKNHTGITFVSSWIDGANVTYYEESKDLRVEIVSEIFWNAKHVMVCMLENKDNFVACVQ